MRKIIENQMQLGEVDITAIKFDLRSRDDMAPITNGFAIHLQ